MTFVYVSWQAASSGAANNDATPDVAQAAKECDILFTDAKEVLQSLGWMNGFAKCVTLTLKNAVYTLSPTKQS